MLRCSTAGPTLAIGTSVTDNLDDSRIFLYRCLAFAHLQQTLGITEQMLQDELPRVTDWRLDGRTAHSKRADIVQCFNSDPSNDIFLLAVSVGGMGLTLTDADTVIFIEHSWNTFVDLQATDRAHRIGQKRCPFFVGRRGISERAHRIFSRIQKSSRGIRQCKRAMLEVL